MVINSSGTVRDKHRYQAFGGSDGSSVVLGQAYRYTGKPLDEEFDLDWYYYGARYYDPSIGRFPSIDPLHGKSPGWSPYAYCLNNPLRLVDPDGLAPGDHFLTMDQAALDCGMCYNSRSILEDREYSTNIYWVDQGANSYFSYDVPRWGGAHNVLVRRDPGKTYVASQHGHGAYSGPQYSDNTFSTTDYLNLSDLGPMYLSTPNGSLLKWQIPMDAPQVLSTGLPSDPNDPTRKNSVDPSPAHQCNNSQASTKTNSWTTWLPWWARVFIEKIEQSQETVFRDVPAKPGQFQNRIER